MKAGSPLQSLRSMKRGQRLTAGWAQQCWFCKLYGAATAQEILGTAATGAPDRGGGQALPGGTERLDSGQDGCRSERPDCPA